jgi:hypothetical protein
LAGPLIVGGRVVFSRAYKTCGDAAGGPFEKPLGAARRRLVVVVVQPQGLGARAFAEAIRPGRRKIGSQCQKRCGTHGGAAAGRPKVVRRVHFLQRQLAPHV